MQNPKVSIIIPARNEEGILFECLTAIAKQDYINYQVIIVDNDSTDQTKSVIRKFQKKHRNFIYVFEKRIGRGPARHTGEQAATGEIILMTDADCIVPPNWIREIIKPIVSNRSIAVQGGFKLAKLNQNYWTLNIQNERARLQQLRIKDGKIGLLDTGNFAIKRSVLNKIGYSNQHLVSGNDTELEINLKNNQYDIYYQPTKVFHYEPDTLQQVFRKLFIRGMWNKKIRTQYKQNTYLTSNHHTRYIIGNLLGVITLQKNTLYYLITGLAWRLGYMYEYIKLS